MRVSFEVWAVSRIWLSAGLIKQTSEQQDAIKDEQTYRIILGFDTSNDMTEYPQ